MITGRVDCGVAERLAGTIALGEATDSERETYRGHLARCGVCLSNLGGEREIERIMTAIVRAREQESWEPDLRAALARGRNSRLAWIVSAVLALVVVAMIFARPGAPPRSAPPSQPSISASEARAIAALNTQSIPRREGRAESLTVGSAPLAASIELSIDARGMPVRCSVTRSSGDPALDLSICRRVMQQRYSHSSR